MTEQKKLTALVVDDHEESRDILVKILSLYPNFNIEVAEARNGQEAYDKIREKKPDILYTGVLMPGLSGSELLEKLVDDTKIPTFIVSASAAIHSNESEKTVTLASQMYTDAQRVYIEGKTRGDLSNFILVVKPYPPRVIADRTEVVQEMLYKGIK